MLTISGNVISVKCFIATDYRNYFADCLSNNQAIKRIGVMKRQRCDNTSVFWCNTQNPYPILAQLSHQTG